MLRTCQTYRFPFDAATCSYTKYINMNELVGLFHRKETYTLLRAVGVSIVATPTAGVEFTLTARHTARVPARQHVCCTILTHPPQIIYLTYLHVCAHACAHVRAHVCAHVCVHACVHVCVHECVTYKSNFSGANLSGIFLGAFFCRTLDEKWRSIQLRLHTCACHLTKQRKLLT